MSEPNFLIKAQVVRVLCLENYYELAPILRRSKVKVHRIHGTPMIAVKDIPKLKAMQKEMGK